MQIENLSELTEALLGAREEKYRDFSSSLIPNIPKERVLGVRLPVLRKVARSLTAEAREQFLNKLPHLYLEEYHLHSFLISDIKDISLCIGEVDRFLPYVDNWAVCDSLRPSCFKGASVELLPVIDGWLSSSHPYAVRFGIEMLMLHFLDRSFDPSIIGRVAAVRSDNYYVNMMVAWFFAEALTKRWDESISYLKQRRLSPWIHGRCISKCIDSRRISLEQKELLRGIK